MTSIYRVTIQEVPTNPEEDRPDFVVVRVVASSPDSAATTGLATASAIARFARAMAGPMLEVIDEGAAGLIAASDIDGFVISVDARFGLDPNDLGYENELQS